MNRLQSSVSVLAIVCSLAACADAPPTASSDPASSETATTETSTTETSTTETPTASEAETEAPQAEASAENASIATLELTNVSTGETFTLNDFSGQTVVVKPMATWCGNCRENFQGVSSAIAEESDPPVIVAVSVEANLPNEELAKYAEDEGFDFIFTVASPEVLRALETQFGAAALNPSSTPRFIIKPDGTTTELTTGKVEPETFIEEVRSAS